MPHLERPKKIDVCLKNIKNFLKDRKIILSIFGTAILISVIILKFLKFNHSESKV